jgi:hypothetical protein
MIDLKPYVKRRVLIQLKAPYQYQLVRSNGGKPVPLAIVEKDGKAVLASTSDIQARPLTVDVLVGVVIERDGRCVVEMDDQTSPQGHKIEAELSSEFIQAVSVVREDSVITLG